jgi:hypothetical protein
MTASNKCNLTLHNCLHNRNGRPESHSEYLEKQLLTIVLSQFAEKRHIVQRLIRSISKNDGRI